MHARNGLLEICEGTAEETGLADASFDMVRAGRAMHWFDPERSMREFKRILKPSGWIAIAAFGRTEHGREENEAFEQLLRSSSPGDAHTHAGYEAYKRLEGFFAGGEFHHAEIFGEVALDWEQLRGMVLSLSHAPRADEPKFQILEKELRACYTKYARQGIFTLETRYWINAGRFA